MSLSQGSANQKVVPELQRNIEILREVPFFEGFPQEVLKLLAYLSVRGDYEAGDIIFENGDDPGMAFSIVSGSAAVYRSGQNGETVLRKYTEGAFLGCFSLIGPMPSLFTLKAESALRLLIINRENFSTVMEQHSELGPLLKKSLLKELRRWEQANIEDLGDCCLQKVGVTLL